MLPDAELIGPELNLLEAVDSGMYDIVFPFVPIYFDIYLTYNMLRNSMKRGLDEERLYTNRMVPTAKVDK